MWYNISILGGIRMKLKSLIVGIICLSTISLAEGLKVDDYKVKEYVKSNYESSVMRKEVYNLEVKRASFINDIEKNGTNEEKKVLSKVLDTYDPYEFSFTVVYEMYKQELKAVKEGW